MKIRFIAALVLASLWEIREQFLGIRSALKQAGKSEVPIGVQAQRITRCEQCPIYYRPLRTCGSPMARKSWPNGEKMGCFCYMPVKIKTKCNCWLYDETNGKMGWPKDLNNFQ
jgi:hypothetical protein